MRYHLSDKYACSQLPPSYIFHIERLRVDNLHSYFYSEPSREHEPNRVDEKRLQSFQSKH